jgi:cytidine deaminase
MRNISLRDLDEADQALVKMAQEISARAYAPYSGFAVGAAVRTASKNVFIGANLENAAYGVTMCGEVSALTRANAENDFDVEAIAVVGHKFTKPVDALQVVTPCGRCRQLIAEAAQLAKRDVRVLSCNGDLTRILEATISELLPEAFGPANLGLADTWPKLREKLRARTKRLMALHRKS